MSLDVRYRCGTGDLRPCLCDRVQCYGKIERRQTEVAWILASRLVARFFIHMLALCSIILCAVSIFWVNSHQRLVAKQRAASRCHKSQPTPYQSSVQTEAFYWVNYRFIY